MPFGELSETDSAWLAGLIDGEGSLNVYFRNQIKRQGKGSNYGVFLQIVNTDKDIIGKVVYLCQANTPTIVRKKNRLPCYHVSISKRTEIIRILRAISPYLTGYKKKRACLLLKYCESRSTWGKGNGHQLTPSELSLLKQIQETK